MTSILGPRRLNADGSLQSPRIDLITGHDIEQAADSHRSYGKMGHLVYKVIVSALPQQLLNLRPTGPIRRVQMILL